ncbi:MAG: TetR/AcrR family transcriptional regulator [Pseudomonadales bacterium]|nr:TetR/AcrR family transcriptional regulator [Pseudomonadales bacterium]
MNEQKPGRSYRGIDAEDRQQKRREALIQAGFELFGSRGYRATSVKLVCDHVGLTERYFYESFANREALLLAVYAELGTELEARLIQAIEQEDTASHERLEQVLSSFFQYIQEDKRRGRIMFLEIVGVSQQVDRNYQSVVRDQAASLAHPNLGIFSPDSRLSEDDRRVITIGLIGAITQIAAQWVLEDFTTDKRLVVENAVRICVATSRYLADT